jgi:nucleoside-diphosphate-sugar epimerase
MIDILILGNRGYIGSYLTSILHDKYNITGIDIGWDDTDKKSTDYRSLDEKFLDTFDVIILLAGHSSVKMCDNNVISSFNNNVRNFIELLSKVNNQKFIYASSSSIYGSVLKTGEIASEDMDKYVAMNYYDLTKYQIDKYSELSNTQYYGLRFGTVNGHSPVLRTDVMINSMVNSSFINNHLKVYWGGIHRPILGIHDLKRAIEAIVDCNEDNRGIYNLASFNSTTIEIGKEVSEIMKCCIKEETSVDNYTKPYDFQIDSSSFMKTFNFRFEETVESITISLKNNFDKCVKTSRNEAVKYR